MNETTQEFWQLVAQSELLPMEISVICSAPINALIDWINGGDVPLSAVDALKRYLGVETNEFTSGKDK